MLQITRNAADNPLRSTDAGSKMRRDSRPKRSKYCANCIIKFQNPATILKIRDFSCKKVQSTKYRFLSFFSTVLSFFFPVWRVGVNLNFFSSSQNFFLVSTRHLGGCNCLVEFIPQILPLWLWQDTTGPWPLLFAPFLQCKALFGGPLFALADIPDDPGLVILEPRPWQDWFFFAMLTYQERHVEKMIVEHLNRWCDGTFRMLAWRGPPDLAEPGGESNMAVKSVN